MEEGLTEALADRAIAILLHQGLPARQQALPLRQEPAPSDGECRRAARVFILAGQSNMVGRARAETLPADCCDGGERVQMRWCNDLNFATVGEENTSHGASSGWQRLQPQWSPIGQYHHYGPEMTLARELLKLFPEDDLYFVKYAMGSTSLQTHWNPETSGAPSGKDGVYFKHFISFCYQALASLAHLDVSLEAMFWLQGEGDSGKANLAKAYYDNLLLFIESVRQQLGKPQLPFIASEIFWRAKQTKKVNAAIRALQDSGETSRYAWVDAPDGGVLHDGHLNPPSIACAGVRFAEAFKKSFYPTVQSASQMR